MQQEAIQKIDDGMKDCKEKRIPAEPIAQFLKDKCNEDAEFSAQVMQEHKTLPKCFDFVYEQAHKHLNGSNGWINDDEVFNMAADYFALDDAELERKKAEEEAERDEKRREQAEERKQKADEEKAKKDAEVKKKKADAKIPEGQMSLF